MANPEKGEISVELDGRSYTLCMDMPAMIRLETRFGMKFGQIIGEIEDGSITHLLPYLWVSFLKYQPEITESAVSDLIQRNGGVIRFSGLLVAQLAKATVPAAEDVAALKVGKADPIKARTRRQAGIGARSGSKRAALG